MVLRKRKLAATKETAEDTKTTSVQKGKNKTAAATKNVQTNKNNAAENTGAEKMRRNLVSLFEKTQSAKIIPADALAILIRYYEKVTGVVGENNENAPPSDEAGLAAAVSGVSGQEFNLILAEIMTENFEIGQKSFPVDRSMKLYSCFVCHCIKHDYVSYIDHFAWIIKEFHDDMRKSFRLRLCQLILLVMTECADGEIDLPESLWILLRNTLLVRSRDKKTEIRLTAVKALMFFQPQIEVEDEENNAATNPKPTGASQQIDALDNDLVVKQLAYLLEVEQISEIRKTILSSVLINNGTMLKCLLRHCRDVDLSCRAACLNSLAQSISIMALSSQQRVDILTISFRNIDHAVMAPAVKCLVQGWLSQLDGSISEFLTLIDPVVEQSLCKQLVNSIYQSLPSAQQAIESFDILDERKLLEDKWCTPELAFQWMSLLLFLKENHQNDLFDKLSPNITAFAQFLAYHFRRIGETNVEDELISRTFVVEQLLEIASILDVSMDEMGRKKLANVLEENLKNCSSNEYSRLVHKELEILLKLLGQQKFVYSALEAISELRFPLGGTSSSEIEMQNSIMANSTKDDQNETAKSGDGDTSKSNAKIVNDSVILEHEFKIGQLRVEIHKQTDKMDEYANSHDYVKAQQEKEVLDQMEQQLQQLQQSYEKLKYGSNKAKKDNEISGGDKEKPVDADTKAADGENVDSASVQKESDTQESNDPIAIFQWLSIAQKIPQLVLFRVLPAALCELRDGLMKKLATPVDAIRRKTVQCIGVYSVFDRDYCIKMLPLIVQVIIIDPKETVQLTAFRVLMDCLLRYGMSIAGSNWTVQDAGDVTGTSLDLTSLNDTFLNHAPIVDESCLSRRNSNCNPNDSQPQGTNNSLADHEPSSSQQLLKLIVKYLDNINAEMRTVAAEGLAKLMVHGKISSPDVFARLCILWCSPTSQQDTYLRQCLAQFFPLFAIKSVAHQDCIRKSFLPILKIIFRAPLTSPLATIDCESLVKYLMILTSPLNERLIVQNPDALTVIKQAGVHEKLGKQLCEEILKCPDESYVPILIKALTHLHIDDNDSEVLTQQAFADYLTEIEQVVDSATSKRTVARLKARALGILNESMRSSSAGSEDGDGRSSNVDGANATLASVISHNDEVLQQPSPLINLSHLATVLESETEEGIESGDEQVPSTPTTSTTRKSVQKTSPMRDEALDKSEAEQSPTDEEPVRPRRGGRQKKTKGQKK